MYKRNAGSTKLAKFFFFFFTHKTELKSKFDSTAPTQYLEQRQLKNRQRILARKTLFLNDVQQRKD